MSDPAPRQSASGLQEAPPSARFSPELVVRKASPYNAETVLSLHSDLNTPSDLYFVRNHFDIPLESTDTLSVMGLVDNPVELSVEEIRSLPTTTLTATMECAGNGRAHLHPQPPGVPWGIGAVSTAQWTGTLLRQVVDLARPIALAETIVFTGRDRGTVDASTREISYERSLSLEEGRQESVMVVYEMNGEPLPLERGGPLRLLVAGWYGMASVKWLHEIRLIQGTFTGYYQAEDYVIRRGGLATPCRQMAVRSVITSPQQDEIYELGQEIRVAGYAWSGEAPIQSVRLSVDGGTRWMSARLEQPLSLYAWQSWSAPWTPAQPGEYLLIPRAIDEAGRLQPLHQQWNEAGYSNNASVPVRVTVQ